MELHLEDLAGVGDPNIASDEARAFAKTKMAKAVDAMAPGDAAMAEFVHKQQEPASIKSSYMPRNAEGIATKAGR